MIVKGIPGHWKQDTWLLWLFSNLIWCHLLFHYAPEKNMNHRGRSIISVVIILGPELLQAWTNAGKPPNIMSASNSDFTGRIIGVVLWFTNQSNQKLDMYHRKSRWQIKIFLSSIYHTVEHDKKRCPRRNWKYYIVTYLGTLNSYMVRTPMPTLAYDKIFSICVGTPWERQSQHEGYISIHLT